MIEAANLSALDRVRHGFFTRAGGVSQGPYDSLNCGWSTGDDPGAVGRNRALALERLGLATDSLCTARQVHGAEVLVVRAPQPGPPQSVADAVVTDRPGITLGVLCADCAPVLLADPVAGVIGAAHAGWRGALSGVIEATVAVMVELGADHARLRAAVGPCIGFASYEVGPELLERFARKDPGCEHLFDAMPRSDRLRFDLKGFALRRLEQARVADRTALPHDSWADETRFFSARRSRQRGEERFGLLLSTIALER
jgi:YfiH family protein